ncbi:hypothetical protein GW17_00054930, partial [Ensete ventricosum]
AVHTGADLALRTSALQPQALLALPRRQNVHLAGMRSHRSSELPSNRPDGRMLQEEKGRELGRAVHEQLVQ